jgi:hypothetical protein
MAAAVGGEWGRAHWRAGNSTLRLTVSGPGAGWEIHYKKNTETSVSQKPTAVNPKLTEVSFFFIGFKLTSLDP